MQWLVQRGPHLRPHPLLQHLHLLPRLRQHQLLRLLLHLLQHLSLLLHLLLHLSLLLHRLQRLLSQPRRAKPTNCFRQLFDDWLMSTKLQSTH